jgi:hypothetical protein
LSLVLCLLVLGLWLRSVWFYDAFYWDDFESRPQGVFFTQRWAESAAGGVAICRAGQFFSTRSFYKPDGTMAFPMLSGFFPGGPYENPVEYPRVEGPTSGVPIGGFWAFTSRSSEPLAEFSVQQVIAPYWFFVVLTGILPARWLLQCHHVHVRAWNGVRWLATDPAVRPFFWSHLFASYVLSFVFALFGASLNGPRWPAPMGFMIDTLLAPLTAPLDIIRAASHEANVGTPGLSIIAFGVYTVAFTVAHLSWFRPRYLLQERRRRGLCPLCGYDMRATPTRCPECGSVPATVHTDGN